jgi:hypothetical protein
MKQPDPSPKIKKRDPKTELARKKANRTDAAGRSGFGETAGSYVTYKEYAGPGSARMYKPSLAEASNRTKAPWNSTSEGIAMAVGAEDYAYKRKQAMNPRRDNSGYGEAGFGRTKPRK